MEPDKVIQTESWSAAVDYDYEVIGSQIAAKAVEIMDDKAKKEVLKQLSTRDLLNECYRRRAIEKFSLSYEVDNYMLDDTNGAEKAKAFHLRDFANSLADHKYFTERAVMVAMGLSDKYRMTTNYKAEVYVCSHPSIVKGGKL